MELYYRINIYFLIFIVLYYTVRVYLINILEKNVKLLPWHVLICVYVGIFCNLFCAKIIHMNFHLPAPAIVCREVGCSRISLFNSIKNWQCSYVFSNKNVVNLLSMYSRVEYNLHTRSFLLDCSSVILITTYKIARMSILFFYEHGVA